MQRDLEDITGSCAHGPVNFLNELLEHFQDIDQL
jgi:hypothetical protein